MQSGSHAVVMFMLIMIIILCDELKFQLEMIQRLLCLSSLHVTLFPSLLYDCNKGAERSKVKPTAENEKVGITRGGLNQDFRLPEMKNIDQTLTSALSCDLNATWPLANTAHDPLACCVPTLFVTCSVLILTLFPYQLPLI